MALLAGEIMMFKPRNTEERQRRLMGPLLLIFDYLHGKSG